MLTLPPWIQILTSLTVVAALGLAAYAIGARLLARVTFDSAWERTAVVTVIGLGALGVVLFLVGLVGLLRPALVGAGIAAAAAPALPHAMRGLGEAARRFRALPARARLVRGLAALLLLVPLLLALRPPTAFDATLYHLAFVRRYAATHRVAPVENLRYPVFPQLSEMLFTAAWTLGGEPAPALVEVLFAALTALAVAAWGRRLRPGPLGPLAAALWLGSPLVAFLATAPYVDAGLCAYCTVGALAWARFGEAPTARGWPAIAGAAMGFAAGTKYLGLAVGAGVGAGLLVDALRARRPRALLAFGGLALAVALPWYIYIAAHTKNPVFPFASSLFGLGPWTPNDLAVQLGDMRSVGIGHSLGALVGLPWQLTAHQVRFRSEAIFLPVFVVALPLALVGAARDRRLGRPLGLALAYGLFWFSTVQFLRYLVPASALFALAVAGGLGAWRRARPLAWALGLVLCAPASVYGVGWLAHSGLPLSPRAREAFLKRELPGWTAVSYLNRVEGARYRLYAFNFEHLFYYADGYMLGDWMGRGRYDDALRFATRPDLLVAYLRGFGITHMLAPRTPDTEQVFRLVSFRERFDELLVTDEWRLFRLR
jgi:hypothetical protein